MVRKVEYDFWPNCISPPSCRKVFNDEPTWWYPWEASTPTIRVLPNSNVTIKVWAKQENALNTEYKSVVSLKGWDGETYRWIPPGGIGLPIGTFDWQEFEIKFPIPDDIIGIILRTAVGGGLSPETPCIIWYDDLRIYMDDALIYENDFSDWAPVIGAGLGMITLGYVGYTYPVEPLGKPLTTLLGAAVGAGLGGGLGYALTQQAISMPVATPLIAQ